MPRVTTLTQRKGLRRGLDLNVGAGLNVFRVNKPTRLNKIWKVKYKKFSKSKNHITSSS